MFHVYFFTGKTSQLKFFRQITIYHPNDFFLHMYDDDLSSYTQWMIETNYGKFQKHQQDQFYTGISFSQLLTAI